MVMALEVFEHFEEPETFFDDVIEPVCEKHLLYSAPWGWLDAGHFPTYHGVNGKKYARRFSEFLKKRGFYLLEKGFNARQVIYERGE